MSEGTWGKTISEIRLSSRCLYWQRRRIAATQSPDCISCMSVGWVTRHHPPISHQSGRAPWITTLMRVWINDFTLQRGKRFIMNDFTAACIHFTPDPVTCKANINECMKGRLLDVIKRSWGRDPNSPRESQEAVHTQLLHQHGSWRLWERYADQHRLLIIQLQRMQQEPLYNMCSTVASHTSLVIFSHKGYAHPL